jgi:serine protease
MTWPSLKLWCVSISAAVLLFLFSPPARSQNTLNVPADYPTIQSAINAANNGDTVLVAPGTYVENINFNGKAITVISSGGAATTIIDGNHNGTVVTFNHSETLSTVLSGFTIRNGFRSGLWGAGIAVTSASPTITANVITSNHAAVAIGIYVDSGSPLISNNTITNNDQTGAGDGGLGGGGIEVAGSSSGPANPQIINNTITNNGVADGATAAAFPSCMTAAQ